MRVLLIDDHALVRKGIEELLRSRGVRVVASVSSGEEGVRRARELPADVILLDIKMPGMTGIETLRQLRANGVATPVVMLTMSREDADLSAALRGGAQGYLLKDIEPEELVPALEAALSGDNVVAREMVGTLARLVRDDAGPDPEERRPAAPFARPHAARARDPGVHRRRLEQQDDRARPGDHRRNRQASRQGDPAQARDALASRGRRQRGRARTGKVPTQVPSGSRRMRPRAPGMRVTASGLQRVDEQLRARRAVFLEQVLGGVHELRSARDVDVVAVRARDGPRAAAAARLAGRRRPAKRRPSSMGRSGSCPARRSMNGTDCRDSGHACRTQSSTAPATRPRRAPSRARAGS